MTSEELNGIAAAAVMERDEEHGLSEAGQTVAPGNGKAPGQTVAPDVFDTLEEHLSEEGQAATTAASKKWYDGVLLQKKAAMAQRKTLAAFRETWLRNAASNLPGLKRYPGIKRLTGGFFGCPAVILCNGPSLDESLRALKPFERRFVKIAVDSAYERCLAAGIRPDITVTVDAQERTAKFFRRHRRGDVVAMSPNQDPKTIGMVAGDDRLMYTDWLSGPDEVTEIIVRKHLECNSEYFGGILHFGVVGTIAVMLSVRMHCDPIIMAGHDLSYSTGEHIPYGEEFDIEDPPRETVRTNDAFLIERFNFENCIIPETAGLGYRMLWAGEGGLRIEGGVRGPAGEVFEANAGPEENYRKRVRRLMNDEKAPGKIYRDSVALREALMARREEEKAAEG